MKNLEGYREGTKMRGILADFWARQESVTQKHEYHVPQFRATHGTTQGALTFPSQFNVVVDTVVRHCLSMAVEDIAVIHNRLRHEARRRMGVFYTYDGIIGLRYPE